MDSLQKKGRPIMEESDKKNKKISFRITYRDYIKIIKNKPSHLTDSAFFLDILVNKKTIFLDYNKLDSYLYEVKKIGSNINQIAKKVNSFNGIDMNDKAELTTKINLLNDYYFKLLNEISKK